MKNLIKKCFHCMGLEIHKRRPETRAIQNSQYTLHQYVREDGTFDEELYRRIQTEGNKLKLDWVWVNQDHVRKLSDYLKREVGEIHFGICHGTRRGNEQAWFKESLGGNCDVIGTEISDTATQFPNTVQWDFHRENPDWVGKADFVYSNSFDHSHDPQKAIETWMQSLKPGGVCLLEHASTHGSEHTSALDPFGVSIEVFPYLIAVWAKGRFHVRDILPMVEEGADGKTTRSHVLVLKNSH